MKNIVYAISFLIFASCTKEALRNLEGDYSGTCTSTHYENGVWSSPTTQETYRVNFRGNKLYIGDRYEKLEQDGDYHFYSDDRKTSAHFNEDRLTIDDYPSRSSAGATYCTLVKQ